MTIRRLVMSSIGALVAAAALASSAEAQDFSATFDADAEGFQVYEFDPTFQEDPVPSTPDHVATGGNPGGFIRFSDPDSGGSEWLGYFLASAPVSTSQIGGTVSFDQRTSASPLGGPFIAVQSSDGNEFGTIYCVFDSGIDSTWSNYSVAISPDDPCWLDGSDNSDATPEDFQAALGLGQGVWYFNADFGEDVGEQTDVDNFQITEGEVIVREVTIKYRKRSEVFKGTVGQFDGPAGDACLDGVPVQLYREAGLKDVFIEDDVTNEDGKWKIAKKAKKNKRYYAYAPETGSGPICAEAQSKTIKPLG